MNKIFILLCCLSANIALAQNTTKSASNIVTPQLALNFESAYATYPSLPKGLLEALAQAASHTQNLAPTPNMAHHHGPERFGLFALVEDGEGYFRNTLQLVCATTGVAPSEFKANPQLQIMAVAQYLNGFPYGDTYTLRTAKPLAMMLCEIPETNLQNEYARDLYAYEVCTKFPKKTWIGISPKLIAQNWFTPENYAVLSASAVTINNNGITANNGSKYSAQANSSAQRGGGANGNNATFTTDYAPALWVASPNFSSRGATAISAVAVHTTEGSYAGAISWFQNTASQVSAHYVIRSSDGQVTQCVLESNKAWHIGNENPYTIGIEHEGYVAQTGWYTTAMYTASAALVRDICTSGYGILPTSCYAGASCTGSSSTCLIATTYKIKGHQHFPNQTHNDPGINWDWALYYNLINPCASPTALATSAITTNTTNLTWTAASGAASYSVQYRANGATTWTTATANTNSFALMGLAASTTYNWQVATNCSGNALAYTAGANFTTLAPPCGVPTALATSNLNTSTATLSFAAASGATTYSIEYKTAAATTYTVVKQAVTTLNLTGLAASTVYNWRVKTNCSSGGSAYVTGANFTTQATCYDVNEANNTSGTATALASGVAKYGKICTGDADWFKVVITATQTISVTVSQLPANYNMDLYVGGAYVTASANASTTAETITRTAQPAGAYYFRVYPATATDVNTLLDYKIVATVTAAMVNVTNKDIAENSENINLLRVQNAQIAPNPIENVLNMRYSLADAMRVNIAITDVLGRVIFTQNSTQDAGEQRLELDTAEWLTGVYFVTIEANKERKTLKVLKK